MPYKTVIVDDEPLAIVVLKHYLQDEPDFVMLATFTNPSEALLFLNTHTVDLLFLDINMATLNGIELLKQLHHPPFVVFTTAHKDYLQDGFDHGILDYLQKPVKKERLSLTLERVCQHRSTHKEVDKQLHIKTAQKEFNVQAKHILFIKALKDYCLIFLEDGSKVMALGTLKSIIDKYSLEPMFIRVHKSYLVPAERIREIRYGAIIPIEDHKIPIGRKYKTEVKRMFNT